MDLKNVFFLHWYMSQDITYLSMVLFNTNPLPISAYNCHF